ncbi:MAG: hypothetical protein Crog4KO_22960 [Crocinitomicaceae bacterium]
MKKTQLIKSGLSIPEAKEKFKELRPEVADQFETVWPEWKRRWMEIDLFGVN